MAKYENRVSGVFNRETGETIRRHNPAWRQYEAWLAQGNTPDPQPPATPVRRFDYAGEGERRKARAIARLAETNPIDALLKKAGIK